MARKESLRFHIEQGTEKKAVEKAKLHKYRHPGESYRSKAWFKARQSFFRKETDIAFKKCLDHADNADGRKPPADGGDSWDVPSGMWAARAAFVRERESMLREFYNVLWSSGRMG
jgi:hypothetical protein